MATFQKNKTHCKRGHEFTPENTAIVGARGERRCIACSRIKGREYRKKNPLPIEYTSWSNMRNRCTNKNDQAYKNYGGRGITVCARWDSFEKFLEDMGPRPSLLHSLEREDTNGNYEPGNCKWATCTEQQNNTRTNVRMLYRGEVKTVAEWAREAVVNPHTFRTRLWAGWSLEEALLTPKQERMKTDEDDKAA